MKSNKKGFTIVELVIVVAIIAILAAVLIPTFTNIIRTSHISADTQLIRNLNTALRIDKPEGKHATMHEALQAAYDAGYDIGKINQTAVQENKILWDSKNDVFCYFDSKSTEANKIAYVPEFPMTETPADVDYFVISATLDEKYSTYLYQTALTTVDTNKGVDVGDEAISEVVYTNASGSVVIRTNGGSVRIVNGDVVSHYGYAESVDITKVAADSYHEYGTVGFMQIAEGHIVAEAGSQINTLLVTGTGSAVTVDSNGAEIESAYTTESSAQDKQHGGNLSLEYYEPTAEKTVEAIASELKAAATMFAGGNGTQEKPYLIANGNQWYNLLTKYQGYYMGSSTDGLYVVLKGDIDITGYDITSYNSYPRNFHLDGNGFTMKNFETSIWGEDGTLYLTNTFTNLKLENCHSSDNSLFGGTQNSNTASVTFNNVDLNNCSAVGGAYQYYDGSATATFIDCDVTNTNVLGGYMASGGFIGNISTGVIVIDHCSFGGSVVSTQSACGGFIGQSANYDANKITIKDSTIIAGTVIRNVAGGNVAAFNAHTGSQNYAQFNNSFYGTLETTGTKYKQGTDAATKTYEPICTAADFTLNSDEGTLTYNGSAGLGKIAVQVYVTDDYIYNGKYYGGYNWYVCDPIKANNVVNGTTISGIPVITDFYNVVSSTDTPVGLQTTDTTYVDEIHNGIFYFDAQTYSWGHYMLGGTYKDGAAVEPTSLKVYIKVTVYDNSGSLMGVVSGATLNYSVDLSNHGN